MKKIDLLFTLICCGSHGMEPIQVYEQEETTLSLQVYESEEVDLKFVQQPRTYFSLLSFDVKRLVGSYLDMPTDEVTEDYINRNQKEDFAYVEYWLCKFPQKKRNYYFEWAMDRQSWHAANAFLNLGMSKEFSEEQLKKWWVRLCGSEFQLKDVDKKIIEWFLEKGISPNYALPLSSRIHAIQAAASAGNYEVAQCLINAGADVNVRNEYVYSPLYSAVQYKHIRVARLLLESGARMDLETQEITPLCRAANDNYSDVLQLLLKHTTCVDPSDLKKDSALECAARWSRVACVRLLLAAGADPVRKRKKTAISCAFIGFRWAKTPQEISNARQVFKDMMTKIHTSSCARPNFMKEVEDMHVPYCILRYKDWKRCHFCEFVPELKKKFGD